MLHLIFLDQLPEGIIPRIVADDDVVLLQGAVWLSMTGHAANPGIAQIIRQSANVYVLQDWLAVYGIDSQQILAGVGCVDYPGLVELVVKNPVNMSWC